MKQILLKIIQNILYCIASQLFEKLKKINNKFLKKYLERKKILVKSE